MIEVHVILMKLMIELKNDKKTYNDTAISLIAKIKLTKAKDLYSKYRFKEARDVVKEALRLMPSSSIIWTTMAMVYEALKKYKRAVDFYIIGAIVQPFESLTQWNQIAIKACELGMYTEAIKCYDRILVQNKKDIKVKKFRAFLLWKKNCIVLKHTSFWMGYYNRAISALKLLDRENIINHNFDFEILHTLSRWYYFKKDFESAIILLNNALASKRIVLSMIVMNILAELYIEDSLYKEAYDLIMTENSFKSFISQPCEQNIDLIVKLGICAVKIYRFDEGRGLLTVLHNYTVEGFSDLYCKTGQNFLDLHFYLDAHEYLKPLIQNDLNFYSSIWLEIANCYFGIGDTFRSKLVLIRSLKVRKVYFLPCISRTINLNSLSKTQLWKKRVRINWCKSKKFNFFSYALRCKKNTKGSKILKSFKMVSLTKNGEDYLQTTFPFLFQFLKFTRIENQTEISDATNDKITRSTTLMTFLIYKLRIIRHFPLKISAKLKKDANKRLDYLMKINRNHEITLSENFHHGSKNFKLVKSSIYNTDYKRKTRNRNAKARIIEADKILHCLLVSENKLEIMIGISKFLSLTSKLLSQNMHENFLLFDCILEVFSHLIRESQIGCMSDSFNIIIHYLKYNLSKYPNKNLKHVYPFSKNCNQLKAKQELKSIFPRLIDFSLPYNFHSKSRISWHLMNSFVPYFIVSSYYFFKKDYLAAIHVLFMSHNIKMVKPSFIKKKNQKKPKKIHEVNIKYRVKQNQMSSLNFNLLIPIFFLMISVNYVNFVSFVHWTTFRNCLKVVINSLFWMNIYWDFEHCTQSIVANYNIVVLYELYKLSGSHKQY
eukprot:gnl/TRDRNA2_/TRDRNA2_178063_c0_seq21.p1 gnl/TRDRNA2_/TRDRNA2_178063_c0~~gnl/TRDRNA2_/TRDRNA2_178063_c0_seq21.p1  ORF type:complete len:829 (+),score=-62.13 gnl/TRDRNA2_/TRDRNA2_178063_c0_seq21:81-2567(+)